MDEAFLVKQDALDPQTRISGRWKVIILVFVGCCLGLVSIAWLLNAAQSPEEASCEHLVKYAAVASSAAPTRTGLLEVFQVYQPVLTPKGAIDETVMSNGVENTTTIASAASPSSCEVLLMDHVFAYSYGMPFVGKLMYTAYDFKTY